MQEVNEGVITMDDWGSIMLGAWRECVQPVSELPYPCGGRAGVFTLSSHWSSARAEGCSQGPQLLATSSLTLVPIKHASPASQVQSQGYLQGKCSGGAEQRGECRRRGEVQRRCECRGEICTEGVSYPSSLFLSGAQGRPSPFL